MRLCRTKQDFNEHQNQITLEEIEDIKEQLNNAADKNIMKEIFDNLAPEIQKAVNKNGYVKNLIAKFNDNEIVVKSENIITDAQVKRFNTIAKGNEVIRKNILTEFGYESSKDIKTDKYEDICNRLEIEVAYIEEYEN